MAETLDALLKVTLVLFMVGNLLDMGLRLQLGEALRDLRDVRFVALAVVWGFVALPLLAVALARLLPLAHPYAVGLVLLGMTPCAPFLPPMADRARGDLGYTAAFMLLASVVTVVYMPFAVPLLVKGLSADPLTIAKPLVLFLLVPLAIGLAVQRRSAALASKLQPVVKKVTGLDTLLMLALCVVVYGKGFLALEGSYAIGAQLLFFGAATVLPYLLGFGLPRDQKTVLSLGMATRNLGAAFAPLFAVPGVDRRSIVMVALGVIMQAAFSFGAATFYGRLAPPAAASNGEPS
ncbi:MAG TPA: bile acid:sodium symporter [Thermoanaerobaculia bacterium]|nr:bile acid:sodium symporter [Thermoanaerobaculia bacterium]HQR65861.1 bile acid:sodium symporter [Thermoanaerobaculia bacterium]